MNRLRPNLFDCKYFVLIILDFLSDFVFLTINITNPLIESVVINI